MPISLLPELVDTLRRVARALHPWRDLVRTEEQLLRRARGAFLVHWFGTTVPVERLSLHIVIVNIAALRARYQLAERTLRRPTTEINLTRPLMAMVGVVGAMLFSPTGAWFLMRRAGELMAPGLGLLYRVVLVWIWPAIGLFAAGLGLALGAPFAIALVVSGHGPSHAIHALLGDLALMLEATTRFLDQLTGPRSEVRNPLLSATLHLLDRMAPMTVAILGAGAFFLTRIGPLLDPVMARLAALGDVLSAGFAAAAEVFEGAIEAAKRPFLGQNGLIEVFGRVLDTLLTLPALFSDSFGALADEAGYVLGAIPGAFRAGFSQYFGDVWDSLELQFDDTPVGRLVAQFTRVKPLASQVFAVLDAAPPSPTEPLGAMLDGFWIGVADQLVFGDCRVIRQADRVLGRVDSTPIPDLPTISLAPPPTLPDLPSTRELARSVGLPEHLLTGAGLAQSAQSLRNEAEALVPQLPEAILDDPPSIFTRERRALTRQRGPRPRTPYDDGLRNLILLAVGRVLPPALRVRMPSVRALFAQIDDLVYGRPTPARELPDLELNDNGQLRPVVRSLRIMVENGYPPEVRRFRDQLVEAIRNGTYLATPASP